MIRLDDLDEESGRGLLMVLPELEAKEDLRQIMLIGAAFGGKEGNAYIEFLQQMGWEPMAADGGAKLLEAAEHQRHVQHGLKGV